ncbi:hypothetical protein WJX74_006631 [Apatococcus lobatus]|uniref:Xanthine dehydrogenase n=1 Tax=Apatococcus lobatus TaxID=904363 RepID=A0AAW1R9U9_9CHLO
MKGQALFCYVNGKRRDLPSESAELTLLEFLRDEGLTGTKLGCGEGVCGSCTVMISESFEGKLRHRSVNACLFPLYAADGKHVVTVEGIGSLRSGLHPVQQRLATLHGSQCGFCTPGFVMAMYALLRATGGRPSEQQIRDNLAGNLCRCTGYRPIVDAFKVFAQVPANAYTNDSIQAQQPSPESSNAAAHAAENGFPGPKEPTQQQQLPAKKICPSTGQPCDCNGAASPTNHRNAKGNSFGVQHSSTGTKASADEGTMDLVTCSEPVFPAELRSYQPQDLRLPGPTCTWLRPVTLESLLETRKKYPEARLVAGHNEVGIERKYNQTTPSMLISICSIPELNHIQTGAEEVWVGAAVTLTSLMDLCSHLISSRPAHEIRCFNTLRNQLHHFSGNQVRNTATVGGNIMNASPISDINAIMMAAGAVYELASAGGHRSRIAPEHFLIGYRKVKLQAGQILLGISIPFTAKYEYVSEYKQSHKRDDFLAVGNAAFCVSLEPETEGWHLKEAKVALGGVAPFTQLASRAAAAMRGQSWSQSTLNNTLQAISADITETSESTGWKLDVHKAAVASFLFRFFMSVSAELEAEVPGSAPLFGPADQPGIPADLPFDGLSKGWQHFPVAAPEAVVGHSHMHMAARSQTTGEAMFAGDIKLVGMQHAVLVTSTRARAKILSVNASNALNMKGISGFFDAKAMRGEGSNTSASVASGLHHQQQHNYNNAAGHMKQDEEVFASSEVHTVGQVIGIITAETERQARAAAKAVQVEYEDLPSIVSIQDAIAAGSFFDGPENKVERGKVEEWLSKCDRVLEGSVVVGGQEHFYLEPQVSVVQPQENDELVIHASTQAATAYQHDIARSLGLPSHKVVCHVKRVGGAFGGKETRFIPVTAAAAVAAREINRPLRIALDRHEDMAITGHRHPFFIKYKVGFNKDGKVVAMDAEAFSNGGWCLDMSQAVIGKALLHADNAYRVPHMCFTGRICRTNTASNTSMRGLGGPQIMLAIESIMDRVAAELQLAPEHVRSLNMYREGEKAVCGQGVEAGQLRACWDQVLETSGFEERAGEVARFNQGSRWRKRGISTVPVKFGIGFAGKFMNQGGALVHIYMDGTVLVTTGGIEMGQGLHTKCCMVAAQELGIPLDKVHIAETATDKVPNTSPSAASASSDLYCMAVIDACSQLKGRLAPFRRPKSDAQQNGDAEARPPSFAEAVQAAYQALVDLSAHGFHAITQLTGPGGDMPFKYWTYGAAATEVELDVLTGTHRVIRADIVMDLGQPLNPAIDIGQIEGAYVQGMGMTCKEELVWGDAEHSWLPRGHLQTRGPGSYMIPTADDIPDDLRVTLLEDQPGRIASLSPPDCHSRRQNGRSGGEDRPPALVHSSKNSGEPPFFLGASAFFALKQAVYAARRDAGLPAWVQLDSPASTERVRMACSDHLTPKGALMPPICN